MLVIVVSHTLLMVGGFQSKALLALLEKETVPFTVFCGSGVPLYLSYLASSPPIHDFVLVVLLFLVLKLFSIITVLIVFSAINCFLHSPWTGAIPWSWGARGFFLFDGQKPSQYVRHSREDNLLQLINVTCSRDLSWILVHSLANKSLRTNNNQHSLCPHSPHSRGFNLKIFPF